jgi:hypothetical protein
MSRRSRSSDFPRLCPVAPTATCVAVLLVAGCTGFTVDPPPTAVAADDAGAHCDLTQPFGQPQLVSGLENTAISAVSVGGLRLSPDLLTGYFYASGRADSFGGNDLYTAHRNSPTAPFTIVRTLGMNVNSVNDEFDPAVSGDGLAIVFARAPTALGSVHTLFEATGDPSSFSPANAPGPPFIAGLDDRSPYWIASGALYFATFTVSYDIATSMASGTVLGPPSPLPGSVNTQYSERAPVVTPNELTLYYSSDRPDGDALGSFDIWVATRPSLAEHFSSPVNVGELNSSWLEEPTFVTADGCALYFASDRAGSLAMYVAVKP